MNHDHAAIETRIDSVSYSHPEKLELILAEISEILHENHYLITDTKRRLIDIYGVEENFQYASLDRIKVGSLLILCLYKQVIPINFASFPKRRKFLTVTTC